MLLKQAVESPSIAGVVALYIPSVPRGLFETRKLIEISQRPPSSTNVSTLVNMETRAAGYNFDPLRSVLV